MKGHEGAIVGIRQCPATGGPDLTSASVEGDLIKWDLRQSQMAFHIEAYPRGTLSAIDVHGDLPLVACAGGNSSIRVYEDEHSVGHIRYREGFLAHRLAVVNDLVFHPRRMLLAAGSCDGVVSLFGASG